MALDTLNKKLLSVQMAIGAIPKDMENPFFKSNYFDINALLGIVKPILNKHGIVLMQPLTHIDGKQAIKTMLIDTNGETMESVIPIPEALDAQKLGSAVTYIRRYSLQSMLGIEAEDDDGNKASTPAQQVTKNLPDMSKIPETVAGSGTNVSDTLSTPLLCPVDGALMVERNGKFGKFYGCSNYPKCTGGRDANGVAKK